MTNAEKYLALYTDSNNKGHSLKSTSSIDMFYKGDGQIGFEIDGREVNQQLYLKARELILNSKKTDDSTESPYVSYKEKISAHNNWVSASGKYGVSSITDIANDIYKEIMKPYINNEVKEKEAMNKMPTIMSHKYIIEHGVTILEWSDGTTTKVVCDPMVADCFTGFAVAVAKKAMGNKGKFLSEWERLVIKPEEDKIKAEEKARAEAVRKAEEEKKRAEAKARHDEKKAKRIAKKEELSRQKFVEDMAKMFAKEYNEADLYEEAAKLAIEKYGVPEEFFTDKCDCDCDECDNKE